MKNLDMQKWIVKGLGLVVCLALIAFQVYFGLGVHPEIVIIHTVVAIGLMLIALKSPKSALFILTALILLSGWLSTWISSPDLELRPILVAAAVIGVLLGKREGEEIPNFISFHISLLVFSIITLVSLFSSIIYVTSFCPVPGWQYANVAVNILSVSGSAFITKSLNMAGVYSMWWGVFFLAINQKWDNKFRRQLVLLLLILLSANLLAGLMQLGGFTALSANLLEGNRVRPHGFTQSPHSLNNVAAIIVAFIFIMLNREQNKRWLIPLGLIAVGSILLGGGFTALVFCLSALAASGLTLVFKGGWKELKKERLKRVGGTAVIILVLVAVLLGVLYSTNIGAEVLDRIARLADPGGNDFAMQRFIRQSSWSLGASMAMEYPLGGIGVGTFPITSLNYSALNAAPHFLVDNTLNFFIEIAATLGFPALLLILYLLGKVIFGLIASPRIPDMTTRVLMIIPVAAFCFFGFSGPHLNDMETSLVFWMLLAGLVKRYCNHKASKFEKNVYLSLAPLFVILAVVGAWQFNEKMALQEINKELRWHIGLGNYPREDNGEFWTAQKSIVSFVPQKHYLHLRWRSNANGKDYQPRVRMLINGREVLSLETKSSKWTDSYFFLEKVEPGYSYLSVEVSKAYVPAEKGNSTDDRQLGIKVGIVELLNRLPHEHEGFWGWEEAEGEAFSWTQEEALINLPPRAEKLSFSLRTGRPDIKDNYVKVKMYLCGEEVFKAVLKNTAWQHYSIKMADIIKEKQLSDTCIRLIRNGGILRIRVDGSWSPGEYGSQDTRQLGVAFMPHWDTGGEK